MGGRRGSRKGYGLGKVMTAGHAKFGWLRQRFPTSRAPGLQLASAFQTVLRSVRIVVLAFRTFHGIPPIDMVEQSLPNDELKKEKVGAKSAPRAGRAGKPTFPRWSHQNGPNDSSNLRYHDFGRGIHIIPVVRPLFLLRERI